MYHGLGQLGQLDAVLNAMRGVLNKVADSRARVTMLDNKLKRIAEKVSRTPPDVRGQLSPQLTPMRTRVRELSARVSKQEKEGAAWWAKLQAAIGAGDEALSGGLGQTFALLVGAVLAFIAAVTIFWKVVVNDTRKMNAEADRLELVASGALPPDVLADINRKYQSGSGGFSLFSGGALAIALPILFLLLSGGGGRRRLAPGPEGQWQ